MSRKRSAEIPDILQNDREALNEASSIYYKYIDDAPHKKVSAMSMLHNFSGKDQNKIFGKLEGLLGEKSENFLKDYIQYTTTIAEARASGASREDAEKMAISSETTRLTEEQRTIEPESRSSSPPPIIDEATYIETRQRRDEAESKLGALFRDKLPADNRDFERAGKKQAGVTEGFAARRKEDQAMHMVKVVPKKMASQERKDQQNRSDLVTEYIYGGIYERLLFDCAPKINLVEREDENISITSKFFGNFKTLTELTGKSSNGDIDSDHPDLQKIKGFEKVIAACVFCGEIDYHASNIGAVKEADGSLTAVKIDHGRSADTYRDEFEARKTLTSNFETFGYEKMRFNISEFREHIEQMTNITTEETQKFVGSKVDELSKRDFDFAGTRTIGDFDKKTPTFRENNPARVAAYFSDDFIKRKNVMKEMASTISLIENIEPLSNKSRKGEWVERYASKSREEIIDFVIKKDRSIKQEHLQKMLLGETANPETDQKIAIKYLAKKHKLKEATLTKLVKTSGFLASDKDTNPQMTKEQKLFKFALSVGKLTGPEAKPYLNATEELRASKDTSLGPRSPTYRLFMNHDSDKLVRIFLQAEKDAKKDPEKKSHEAAIDMNKLLKDAPPEMLFKIREVGQKLKLKSEEEPRQSWIKRVKSSFSAWLNKSKDKQILDELTAGGVIKITKASDIRQALTASPKPKASHSTGQHVAIRNIGIDF